MDYMTKRLLIFGIFLFSVLGNVIAQSKPEKKKEKYSYSLYTKVYQKRLVENSKKVKDTVLLKLADSYYYIADYKNAAIIYDTLNIRVKNGSGFIIKPEVNFRHGHSLRAIGKEEEAKLKLAAFFDKSGEKAVKKSSRKYELKNLQALFANLKDSINLDTYSDFAPAFYKQGLIFSSDRDTGNLHRYRHSGTNNDFLDLYQIKYDEDSLQIITKLNFLGNGFTAREAESTSIKVDESTATFTKDGKTMYFTATNFNDEGHIKDKNNIVRLKIYKAVLTPEGWKISDDSWYRNQNGDKAFNTDSHSFSNPALSPDDSKLYFASDMPGTKGLSDIFFISINENGVYDSVKNLGDSINTPFRDTFPFISADGFLYFSSDGLKGNGRLDVFSIKLNDEGRPIGNPENLGEPINSKQDDFTFIYNSDENYGFFASNRERAGEYKDDNIYAFTDDCIKAKTLSGYVYDRSTELPLAGATIYIINDKNEIIATKITNAEGAYTVPIDRGINNFVRASMEGYIKTEEYLEIDPCQLREVDLYLEPNCVSYDTDLAKLLGLDPTIFFDFDKSEIKSDYQDELDIIVTAMKIYPSLRIQVNSHTDVRGDNKTYNQPLSERRAEATVNYIVSNGIDKSRLKFKGYGETKPVNECVDGVLCSAAKHQENRRSEFIILCEEGEKCCY
jgi:outer membrane protein OmpA-like peptidoglycan-associated protein